MFDDNSDSDVEIKTDNEYARNYNKWRKKEEFNKLKTKYGEDLMESESSSSEDDDVVELPEQLEKQFFKTLSCLKNKDPCIYDGAYNFFDDSVDPNAKKEKKNKPMYINDYERELLLKNKFELDNNDVVEVLDSFPSSATYVEEQKKLKESLKNELNQVDDDDKDDETGGILTIRQRSDEEKKKEEADYIEWLTGQKKELGDKQTELELKPLKEYWNSPSLDEGEKFLRDYILQKRFLNDENHDYIPTYEEIIHDSDKDLSEDENNIEMQETFEHKYNFRFEEPDQEFIKRYPRIMEQSLRKTDDRRKLKRAETKQRKLKEKEQKMYELNKLQELKKKEIEEKIQKLKEITGNKDIQLADEDLDGDFDPEAHDRKMQTLFNDEFYEGPEGDQKPEFPELDEYLEIENWEKWEGKEEHEQEDAPHCDDEDFNMDCDYNHQTAEVELIKNSKGKRKRKRKSLFAKAISQPKPVFDPNDKTYEQYLDEYYKFDCEDIIGDTPCRFKYRKVIPNSFGLTVEEILTANDRELNKWCSLKKAIQHRPDHVEKYDKVAYAKKANNVELKRKILPSLFASESTQEVQEGSKKGKKMKKVCCKKTKDVVNEQQPTVANENVKTKKKIANKKLLQDKTKKDKQKRKGKNIIVENNEGNKTEKRTVKRKISGSMDYKTPKKVKNISKSENVGISDARFSAYGVNPKKFKNKLKYKKL